ncbi:GNAT family N-acetyltransferase [Deinococcus radiophilus]|uniref:N-acetyltransferase n=1 Tax=Deinococcus radiophilus TaxID=32062 RepID=A0A3S0L2D4_9DEIO|nr:GNAT family N-acetyltransferase [Deinococcus radiophilus]RTR25366.1 N-acetyltransferase [Deinococcus radiophilus]UFA51654.1 GNAT family N-acetyltransferase [Deinococcus radiophilus]
MKEAADPNPPLVTGRLRLEPQRAEHTPLMMRVLADPRTHTYLPSDPPEDEAALRERYARLESRRSPDGSELWLNWVVFQSTQAIGTVQATVQPERAQAEVAYVFHPGNWGQGYAAEAVQALLDFLCTELEVKQFRATTDTRNLASQRLLERLGFTQVSEIRGADKFKGTVSDEYIYERGCGE